MPADRASTARWLPLPLGILLLVMLGPWRQGLAPAALADPWQVQAQQQRQQREAPAIDLAAATPVHGWQQKRGPSATLTAVGAQLAAGRDARAALAFPRGWRAARLAGLRQPPPAKWCAILFNDRYRLIYLKCPKTGGSALVAYFGLCPSPKASCLRHLDFGNATQVEHLHAAWPHYFVFGFTRNILARAVSQYKYLTHFMAGCPAVSWGAFCRDPFALGDACHNTALHEGASCCRQSPLHHYLHAAPQAHCFTTERNQSAVDWLGRMEHFDADFAALVGALNARPGVPQLPRRPPPRTNYHSGPCQAAAAAAPGRSLQQAGGGYQWQLAEGTFNPCDPLDYFRGPHAHCRADLLSFFAEDVRLLQPAGSRRA